MRREMMETTPLSEPEKVTHKYDGKTDAEATPPSSIDYSSALACVVGFTARMSNIEDWSQ